MAAESLPFSFGALSSWELEAWYEDLQEVLSSSAYLLFYERVLSKMQPQGREYKSEE